MKIDRMFFEKFEDTVRENDFIAASVEAGQWDRVIDYVNREVFDKPEEYYTLDKLRKAAAVDRRLTLREILEKDLRPDPALQIQGRTAGRRVCQVRCRLQAGGSRGHSGDQELLQGLRHQRPDSAHHRRQGTSPISPPTRSSRLSDFKAVPEKYRTLIPEYIKDYVSLNQFAA